ncbi:MAG: DUF4912 domain-containing protein [Deferribacterota bacterium]|nr:DUF4912 domain-containing protein [Deferribacterota bacterium]
MKYEDYSYKDLYKIAKEKNIKNRSNMSKKMLIEALYALERKKDTAINVENTKIQPSSKTLTKKDKDEDRKVMPQKDDYQIPESYNVDTLVLLPVDPAIQYCYWQISTDTREQYKDYLSKSLYRYKLKLFIKDSEGTKELQEIETGDYGNYYFHHYIPGKLAWAEIGFTSDEEVFIPIITSKRIVVPRAGISDKTDETFLSIDENYMEILKLSGIDSNIHPSSIAFHRELLKQLSKHIKSSGDLYR